MKRNARTIYTVQIRSLSGRRWATFLTTTDRDHAQSEAKRLRSIRQTVRVTKTLASSLAVAA